MKWADKKPTKTGWYWMTNPTHAPRVVLVRKERHSLYASGEQFEEDLLTFNNAYWCGPLPQPRGYTD